MAYLLSCCAVEPQTILLLQFFHGELTRGKRPQHKPRKRFKDVLKSNLKELEIDMDN